MSDIWFSADWHGHHKNIVRGVTDWDKDPTKGKASVDRTRDFDTLEEHDATLVKNINACAKPDDIVYFMGDFAFGGIEEVWNFRKRLHCKNIHLMYGNHDHHLEKNRELPNAHYVQTDKDNYVIVDGPCPETNHHDRAFIRPARTQELFKSAQHYSCREIAGQNIVMSHYSFRTWDRAHRGTWMLYGHSHGTLPEYTVNVFKETGKSAESWQGPGIITETYKTMDVGIDTHPEFRPYHIDEIRKIMEGRINLSADHHNPNTL